MAGFEFRLKTVEKLRESRRNAAAESLRQARQAAELLEHQIEQLRSEMADQIQLQAKAALGVIKTQTVVESQRFHLHLQAQLKLLEEKLAIVSQEIHRRQAWLAEREAELQAMEKLRIRQRDQWQLQQQMLAQNRLDEWAGYAHWKNHQAIPGEEHHP